MMVEMVVIEKNKTWEIVDLPKEKNLVEYRCVFTVKYKVDQTMERYKAQLKAKGYIRS